MADTWLIILNYNGSTDTIQCIESVLNLDNISIALLDNGSTDNSLQLIRDYLRQKVHFIESPADIIDLSHEASKLTLITSKVNLGFAKGINLILKSILPQKDWKYVWLLNNDAIAVPDTLNKLTTSLTPDIGFAGSVILDYNQHNLIQCAGVKYYKYLGVAKMLHKNEMWSNIKNDGIEHSKIAFQHGASLLITRRVVEEIGILDERFFLYSEEHDWQYRAGNAGYKNILVPGSVVYHKGSMSTQSNKYLFFYYYCKSSVMFSRKHYSIITAFIATVMLTGITFVRTRFNFKSFRWALKGIKEAWTYEPK